MNEKFYKTKIISMVKHIEKLTFLESIYFFVKKIYDSQEVANYE
jgi:uncharacterized membrane protein (GlpM family)